MNAATPLGAWGRAVIFLAVAASPVPMPAAVASVPMPAAVARVGFNKHRQLMVAHKLPRDPHTNTINGSIIASWSWLGWGFDVADAPETQSLPDGSISKKDQLWHVSAVKNTSVEYYWLDCGWSVAGFSGVRNRGLV